MEDVRNIHMHCVAPVEQQPYPPTPLEHMGPEAPTGLPVPVEAALKQLESVEFVDPLRMGADATIEEAQRCIVEALDLDTCMLFEPTAGGDFLVTHSWCRPAAPAPPAGLSVRESFPWMFPRLLQGEGVCLSTAEVLSDGLYRSSLLRFGLRSIVVIPLSLEQTVIGGVGFGVTRGERDWSLDVVERLRLSAGLFAGMLARRHSDDALCQALGEIKRLTDQLRAENVYLRREVESTLGTSTVGGSAAILHVQEQVRQVAETDATVLLLGETGSGKEVFASQIHDLSRRRGRTMVRVNCAAIPSTLIESELFGREKGAYTGALSRQAGRFELADGSTIFLDEIGDLPLDVQVKLLRVLEDRQVERLGGTKPMKINTRIVAATHRDLEKRIKADMFREDLYYRLNVFPIRVPPLRERIEDIPLLVWRFVDEFSKAFGKRVESIPKENMSMLQRYPWPGNVRELRNLVERAVIGASGPRLSIALPVGSAERHSVRLVDVEREHVRSVLDAAGWRIRGVGGAAERLGLKATTLETRMAKLGLHRANR
jgi:transcriptional regulator with GAF, ATPase, and Fis domain